MSESKSDGPRQVDDPDYHGYDGEVVDFSRFAG